MSQSVSEIIAVYCLLEVYQTEGGGCWGGLAMRCILMVSQVTVHCPLTRWPSVTALFQAQYSISDHYVMIVNNARASMPLPGFFLLSCRDSLYLTTFEMVYKLNGYKRKVKVFPATASYVVTPTIINDCNVDHIMPKSPLSNLCHTELMVSLCSCCTKRS